MSDFITVAELRIEAERLCDENERLEAENAELRNDADLLRAMLSQERLEKQCYMAENAELQETLQRRTEQFEGMTEMWVERGVENFKLRELVRDMMRFFEDGDYCTACEKVAECDAQEEYDDSCLMRGVFHDRMRELGVDE